VQEGQRAVGDIRVTICRREELYIYAARRRLADIIANIGGRDSPQEKTHRRERPAVEPSMPGGREGLGSV
jgi:hypothetical protein